MPRTKEQFQTIIDQRKEDILDASLRLFAFNGYASVKMDDIAKVAKCSRALVYHYYPTKIDIFKSTMKIVAETMFSITESIDYEKSADSALYELLDKLLVQISSGENRCYMACVIFLILNLHLQKNVLPKPPTIDESRPLGRKRLFEIIYYLIEKGQKENSFNSGSPKEYTIAILTMLNGLSFNKICLKNKMCCPRTEILMNIVRKKEVV